MGGGHKVTGVQYFGEHAIPVVITTTSTTDTAPRVVAGAVGAPASAIEADLCPVPYALAGQSEEGQSPTALRYAEFRTVDPGAARQFFVSAYTPGWWITGLTRGSSVTHHRREAASMTLDEVLIKGRMGLEIPAADSVLVIQPRAGSLTVTRGPSPTVDGPVLVAHGMSCVLHVNAARFDVVSITADILHKVAADRNASLSQQIRFLSWRSRSRAAVRALHRALDYVAATLASADTAQQPLIAAGVAPLLAGALLECYPSSGAEQDLLSDPELPETLKDAVSFIRTHAAGDVGVNDVAAAVHLTPWAVQYLFRRQLDTTPTEYMRRVRLHRAHQELITAERSAGTVAEIAQRWGFAHTGRFAVLYRETYGQSPHTTLRQRPGGH